MMMGLRTAALYPSGTKKKFADYRNTHLNEYYCDWHVIIMLQSKQGVWDMIYSFKMRVCCWLCVCVCLDNSSHYDEDTSHETLDI